MLHAPGASRFCEAYLQDSMIDARGVFRGAHAPSRVVSGAPAGNLLELTRKPQPHFGSDSGRVICPASKTSNSPDLRAVRLDLDFAYFQWITIFSATECLAFGVDSKFKD